MKMAVSKKLLAILRKDKKLQKEFEDQSYKEYDITSKMYEAVYGKTVLSKGDD